MQRSTDEPEVEGQAVRGRVPPAAEVEGHLVRGKGQNDEAPASTELTGSDDDPEVEGNCVGDR